jgi:hypothetical protein
MDVYEEIAPIAAAEGEEQAVRDTPPKAFLLRVVQLGGGLSFGVWGLGGMCIEYRGHPCPDEPPGIDAMPEVALTAEIGSQSARLHVEFAGRLWAYTDGLFDLPSYTVGVDLGPVWLHVGAYVHGVQLYLPLAVGARVAASPPPTQWRAAPYAELRLETLLWGEHRTVHALAGVQWWMDRPRRPPPGEPRFALPGDLSGLPEREGP